MVLHEQGNHRAQQHCFELARHGIAVQTPWIARENLALREPTSILIARSRAENAAMR